MAPRLVALDHVQLAMPTGREDDADAFWVGLLGLEAVPKPEPLAGRGGRWYRGPGFAVHLGVEEGFRPARKAHPALVVDDLDGLVARLEAAGVAWREDRELPGVRRGFVDDPFGNRVELVAAG